jgi:hypothetical protein
MLHVSILMVILCVCVSKARVHLRVDARERFRADDRNIASPSNIGLLNSVLIFSDQLRRFAPARLSRIDSSVLLLVSPLAMTEEKAGRKRRFSASGMRKQGPRRR